MKITLNDFCINYLNPQIIFGRWLRLSIECAASRRRVLCLTSCSPSSESKKKKKRAEMSCGGAVANESKVETISRLAQWRIETLGPCSYRRSDAFKVGIWNWFVHPLRSKDSGFVRSFLPFLGRNLKFLNRVVFGTTFRYLSVEKSRYMYIRIFPEPARISMERPPFAKFVIRVTSSGPVRRRFVSPGISPL